MPDTAPLSETDLVLEADLAAAEPERSVELPTIFLGGLLLLAMLAACYAAAEIVLRPADARHASAGRPR